MAGSKTNKGTKKMSIERVNVESSSLKEVGYDEKTETLEICFGRGAVYRYHKVPSDVHEGLMSSDSIGGYFHRHVKTKFKFEKV
jgi:hypothetical protein